MVRPGPGQHAFPEVALQRDEEEQHSTSGLACGPSSTLPEEWSEPGRRELTWPWTLRTCSGWNSTTCWLMRCARKWRLSPGLRLSGSGASCCSKTRQRLWGGRNSACMLLRVGPDVARFYCASRRLALRLMEARLRLWLGGSAARSPDLFCYRTLLCHCIVCPAGTMDGLARVPVSSRVFGPAVTVIIIIIIDLTVC